MSFRSGPHLVRVVAMLGSIVMAVAAHAQARVPAGADNGASRVLEIERVLGGASIRRDGRTIAMQPGFLLFSGERMTLSAGSRVDLRLLRYGDIDAMSSGNAPGQLVFEKLPFSSWAVDLGTYIRLEHGVLRVRWARSGDAEDWPLAVLIDRWKVELANGEFLFRRDDRGMTTCSVSGKVELVDDKAKVREALTPGRCLTFNRDGTTDRTGLAIAEWPELGVVLLRDDIGSHATDRSLAMKPRPHSAEAVVPPPPPAPAPHVPPPIPPRVPLSVAEESVRAPNADAKAAVAPAMPAAPESSVAPAPAPSSPPPLPAPAQAAETEDATGTGPEWIVNVMSVNDPDVARQHIATLTNAGYPATLRQEVVRGRTSYRVVIGGISNEQGARRTAQLLATKMGYTAAWPLRKR